MTVEEMIARYNAGQCVKIAKELDTHPAAIRVMMCQLRKMGYAVAKPFRAGRTSADSELKYQADAYRKRKERQQPIRDWWKARGF